MGFFFVSLFMRKENQIENRNDTNIFTLQILLGNF